MRDNNLKNIEDKGWNSMKLLLDKELPEQKRNRKIPFWFWFSGAAAILIFGLFFGKSLFYSPTAVAEQKKEQNQINSINTIETNHQGIVNLDSPSTLEKEEINSLKKSTYVNQGDTIISKISSKQKEVSKINNELVSEPSSISGADPLKNNTLIDHINSNNINSQPIESFRVKYQSLEQLPLEALSNFPEMKSDFVIPQWSQHRKISKPSFYLELDGIVFGHKKKTMGFALNAGINKDLNRRFDMDFGVGISSTYYQLREQFDFVSNLSDLESSDPNTNFEPGLDGQESIVTDLSGYMNSGRVLNKNDYSSVLKGLSEIHLLHVPVGIIYHINPRNDIKLGIQYSLLINSRLSNVNIEGVNYAFSTTRGNSLFNQHQLGGNITYYRKINNKLYADIKGLLNFTPLIKSELSFAETSKFSAVSLGLRYNL